MKVTKAMIPFIERALGFELYEWQKAYLLDEPYKEPSGRAVGRTVAYIVKLLLTNEELIDIKKDAKHYQDYPGNHYTHFFISEMRMIDAKLTSVGLPTRSLKLKKNPLSNIQVAVEIDTDKLQRKLRAIAKYTEALADELDAIDNSWQCKCGSINYEDSILNNAETEEVVAHERECNECHKVISMIDELPTRPEVSE